MTDASQSNQSRPVFISYSTDDTTIAEQLRDGLEAASIRCWMAPRDIVPGKEYAEQIIDAIESCAVMVLVVSETSNVSRFVRNEVERAVSKDKVVIPVRIHDVTLSRSLEFFISSAQWIDALHGVQEAVNALVPAIRQHGRVDVTPVPQETARQLPEPHLDTPTPSPLRHNLPAQTTPFIGRESELAEIQTFLVNPSVRLLTVVGPGGMGKTRLALEVAARQVALHQEARDLGQDSQADQRHSGLFPHGVFFVPLAPLSSPEQIPTTIADELGLAAAGSGQDRTPVRQLVDTLKSRRMLLVLDNYEHVVEGAGLVDELLVGAPGVKILVTSRERLQLREEQVYPIGGLEFPDWETPEDAAEYTAVQLFVQSARRIQPDFVLTQADLAPLTRICRLVSGMPLALELAAGWVEFYSPAEIAEEIQSSLDFLETEMRNVPDRHRSMRAVFDYSWQRLGRPEQEVLSQLSVFRGGFDRAAAQAVTGGSLRSLSALVSKSLVQGLPDRRYQLHESVRQYAAQELANQPQAEEAARERHGSFFLDLLRKQESRLKGPEQKDAMELLAQNQENLRAAWRWTMEKGQTDAVDAALWSLGYYHEWQGHYLEGAELFRQMAARAEEQNDSVLGVKSLLWQAQFCHALGDAERVQELLVACDEILGSPDISATAVAPARARLDHLRGMQAHYAGDGTRARAYYRASIDRFHALGDSWSEVRVLVDLAYTIRNLGEIGTAQQRREQVAEAEVALRRALQLSRELGDAIGVARTLNMLGGNLFFAGRISEMSEAIQESMAIFHRLGDQTSLVWGLFWQAVAELILGNTRAGREHIQACRTLAEEIGFHSMMGAILNQDAWSLVQEGRLEEARQTILRCIQVSSESHSHSDHAYALVSLGFAEHELGRDELALQRLRESLQISIRIRTFVPLFRSCLAMAVVLLDLGHTEKAVEVHGLISSFDNYGKTQTTMDTAFENQEAILREIGPETMARAIERGRRGNLWETAHQMLDLIDQLLAA